MTMKENPNVSSKEIYPLNGLRIKTNPLAVEENEGDECWSRKFVEDFPMDNRTRTRTRTRNSAEKEFENGLIYPRRSQDEDANLFSADTNPKLKDLIFYTDKNVLECDTPDLTITCYKDNDYHVVKDICVDEGMPAKGKVLIGSRENYTKGVSGDELEMPKSPLEISRDKDLTQKAEMNSAETDETLSGGLAEYSDGEGNEVVKLPDQKVFSGKPVSVGPDASSPEEGSKENMRESSLCHDSKVQSKSITINLNFPPPATAGISNHVIEQYVDSTNVVDRENSNSHNPSLSSQVHCSGMKNTSIEKVHEESLQAEDGVSHDFSATNDQLLADHKDENNSLDLDLHVLNVNNDPFASQEKHEPGKSSFSGVSFITHSGPIAVSGSISFRSDGSATSGRSFAFPILQSEWNSSPVRMREADGGHFRKHKCWITSLLCCRF